jgi:hypothetical protein
VQHEVFPGGVLGLGDADGKLLHGEGTSTGSAGVAFRPVRGGVDSTAGSGSGSTANEVMIDDFGLAIDATPNLRKAPRSRSVPAC